VPIALIDGMGCSCSTESTAPPHLHSLVSELPEVARVTEKTFKQGVMGPIVLLNFAEIKSPVLSLNLITLAGVIRNFNSYDCLGDSAGNFKGVHNFRSCTDVHTAAMVICDLICMYVNEIVHQLEWSKCLFQ
jgi:hypothetical protein